MFPASLKLRSEYASMGARPITQADGGRRCPLRRACATVLRQSDNDPKVVEAILRHRAIKITLDDYKEAASKEGQKSHDKVVHAVTQKQSVLQLITKQNWASQ